MGSQGISRIASRFTAGLVRNAAVAQGSSSGSRSGAAVPISARIVSQSWLQTRTQSEPPKVRMVRFIFVYAVFETLSILDKKSKHLKSKIKTSKNPEFEPLSPKLGFLGIRLFTVIIGLILHRCLVLQLLMWALCIVEDYIFSYCRFELLFRAVFCSI